MAVRTLLFLGHHNITALVHEVWILHKIPDMCIEQRYESEKANIGIEQDHPVATPSGKK
jgi:hypothetical protein